MQLLTTFQELGLSRSVKTVRERVESLRMEPEEFTLQGRDDVCANDSMQVEEEDLAQQESDDDGAIDDSEVETEDHMQQESDDVSVIALQ